MIGNPANAGSKGTGGLPHHSLPALFTSSLYHHSDYHALHHHSLARNDLMLAHNHLEKQGAPLDDTLVKKSNGVN